MSSAPTKSSKPANNAEPGTKTIAALKLAAANSSEGTCLRVRQASSVSVTNNAHSANSRPSIRAGMSDPMSTPTRPPPTQYDWKAICNEMSRHDVQPLGLAAVTAYASSISAYTEYARAIRFFTTPTGNVNA